MHSLINKSIKEIDNLIINLENIIDLNSEVIELSDNTKLIRARNIALIDSALRTDIQNLSTNTDIIISDHLKNIKKIRQQLLDLLKKG
jgi:hypothetical protein